MEDTNRTEKRKEFLLNIAYWAAIIGIVYIIFKYLLNLLMPFFLAAIFAAVSRPFARLLSSDVRWKKGKNGEKIPVKRRFHLRSTVAGVVSVVLLFLIFAGILTFVLIRVTDSVASLLSTMSDTYYRTILPGLESTFERVSTFIGRFDDTVLEAMQASVPNLISSLGSAITNFSGRALGWISSFAGKLPSILLNFIICLIATVFIAVDFETILRFIRRNLSARTLSMAIDVKNSFLDIVWQFLKSYFIIFCITATEVSVGLLLIGIDRAILLGVLIAVFDAFPIVGSGMILLPWALITLIAGSAGKGLGLFVLYVVVIVVRQFIEPRIVGKHVGLRPIVTLMCMFAGTRLFGGIGLFGLPIAAAILTDMNNSGLIHLFKRSDPVQAAEEGEKNP